MANCVIIAAGAISGPLITLNFSGRTRLPFLLGLLAIGLAAILVANFLILRLAFKPMRELESTMSAVQPGLEEPRVHANFSDPDLRRIATVFNSMLDRLEHERHLSAQRVLQAQERERQRVARELHDQTGQALTSILLGLRAIEDADAGEIHSRVAGLRDLVTEALQDVRRLAVDLRPTTLDDFGVVTAIQRLCGDVAEKSGIPIDFHATREGGRMPREVESCLYRVVQEALTNVIKHANAAHVSVLLAPGDRDLTLLVEDDGAGFAPHDVPPERLGLVGMRERVALVNGSLTVESAPGAGTTLRVTVPLGTAAPG